MAKNTNILLVGVGGQGTLLAADVVALVGMEIGLDVKKSEVHGMAQRGGSVTSHVRWGERVHSPLIPIGEVDYFIAFERLEALRYVDTLSPEAVALVNDYRISPVGVSSGDGVYPSQEDQDAIYGPFIERVHYVPAIDLAQELGNPRVNNVVMLGALSALLDVPEDVWLNVIHERVPERYIALNERAFAVGREHMRVALAR
jgi:indolepyruvate ferredoxin oxidoreductase, beta subunit